MVVVVEVGTCSHLVEVVGRNTVAAHDGVAVYFFPPGVVLYGHLCHFVEPGVVVCVPASVCLGSSVSSFSACGVNLVNVLIGFTHQYWYLKCWQYQKSHHLWLTKLWV